MRYLGFQLWFNQMQQVWMIQEGTEIVGTAKSIIGAQRKIRRLNQEG